MNATATLERPAAQARAEAEHFDVLIVGAGISGVGSAYHLIHQNPGTSFVILETQETFGGTWTTPFVSPIVRVQPTAAETTQP